MFVLFSLDLSWFLLSQNSPSALTLPMFNSVRVALPELVFPVPKFSIAQSPRVISCNVALFSWISVSFLLLLIPAPVSPSWVQFDSTPSCCLGLRATLHYCSKRLICCSGGLKFSCTCVRTVKCSPGSTTTAPTFNILVIVLGWFSLHRVT